MKGSDDGKNTFATGVMHACFLGDCVGLAWEFVCFDVVECKGERERLGNAKKRQREKRMGRRTQRIVEGPNESVFLFFVCFAFWGGRALHMGGMGHQKKKKRTQDLSSVEGEWIHRKSRGK